MGESTEKELLHEVGQLSGKMDLLIKNSEVNRDRIEEVEKIAIESVQSAKSAHHRIDDNTEDTEKALEQHKKDLQQDLKDYKASIRWTVGISVSIASIAVSVLIALFKHYA